MVQRERTGIDKLIEPSIAAVNAEINAANRAHFYPSEVIAAVLDHRNLRRVLADIRQRYGEVWKFDEIIRRYIQASVGRTLQERDSNGIRKYECYGAGERERRWMPLRVMTADTLRAVMRETRTQERHLHVKGEGYEIILEELEKLGPAATVEQVYDQVVPRILQFRGHAKSA